MAKKNKEDKYVFVEYNGSVPSCSYCIFADASEDVCGSHQCRNFERADGKNGYYRAANVTNISYPCPKGGVQ